MPHMDGHLLSRAGGACLVASGTRRAASPRLPRTLLRVARWERSSEFALHYRNQAVAHLVALVAIGRLDHHAYQRLCARRADQHPSAALEPLRLRIDRVPHGAGLLDRLAVGHAHVDEL